MICLNDQRLQLQHIHPWVVPKIIHWKGTFPVIDLQFHSSVDNVWFLLPVTPFCGDGSSLPPWLSSIMIGSQKFCSWLPGESGYPAGGCPRPPCPDWPWWCHLPMRVKEHLLWGLVLCKYAWGSSLRPWASWEMHTPFPVPFSMTLVSFSALMRLFFILILFLQVHLQYIHPVQFLHIFEMTGVLNLKNQLMDCRVGLYNWCSSIFFSFISGLARIQSTCAPASYCRVPDHDTVDQREQGHSWAYSISQPWDSLLPPGQPSAEGAEHERESYAFIFSCARVSVHSSHRDSVQPNIFLSQFVCSRAGSGTGAEETVRPNWSDSANHTREALQKNSRGFAEVWTVGHCHENG